MQDAATEALGDTVLAGCPAIPAGYGVRVGLRASGAVAGGAAGAIAGAEAAERMQRDTAPGDHEGDIYVALTKDRVAIFERKRLLGIWSRLGELLVDFPRAEIKEATFRPSGMGASDLNFELNDGTRYETQVARVNRGKGEGLAAELGAV